jgi:hypothetical protein
MPPTFENLGSSQPASTQVRYLRVLTHRLEPLISTLDRVDKQLVHPLLSKKAYAAVKKPNHDSIPLVGNIRHLI